jgi:hypothetical protein
MSFLPFVIRQSLTDGLTFTGVLPQSNPERSADGSIATFQDRSQGGAFLFSSSQIMLAKRLIISLPGATNWTLGLALSGIMSPIVVPITSYGDHSFVEGIIELDLYLAPGDKLILNSTTATANLKAKAEILAVNPFQTRY